MVLSVFDEVSFQSYILNVGKVGNTSKAILHSFFYPDRLYDTYNQRTDEGSSNLCIKRYRKRTIAIFGSKYIAPETLILLTKQFIYGRNCKKMCENLAISSIISDVAEQTVSLNSVCGDSAGPILIKITEVQQIGLTQICKKCRCLHPLLFNLRAVKLIISELYKQHDV